jgi:hypothetical protein
MPEGPELHLAAQLVRSVASRTSFGGAIKKSEVSTKNPDVEWTSDAYDIDTISRGKEMKLVLTDKVNSRFREIISCTVSCTVILRPSFLPPCHQGVNRLPTR